MSASQPPPQLTAHEAAARLRAGDLLAHATSSLLGIAADPESQLALNRLDALKRRESGQGYVHVVSDPRYAQTWISPIGWRPWRRADLPGPLTWVFPAGPQAPTRVQGPGRTIAIRLDPHPCVRALCDALKRPLVSTSLNLPGRPPAATLNDVPAALWAQLAGAFVRPPPPHGQASTVVRATATSWQLLRAGAVSAATLTRLLGPPEAQP